MTVRWVARLPRRAADRLGEMRLQAGLEVLCQGDDVYLRGTEDELPASVQALPATLYVLLEDDQLVERGRRTPTARMPEGSWSSLAAWLQLELPTAALEAERPQPARLQLVRASEPVEPNVLLAPLAAWSAYAETAAQLRLSRLRFAVDRRRAVVHGRPLPPLVGQRYVETAGVAVPAGWKWWPELDAAVVAKALGAADGDLHLLSVDGPAERILAAQFAPALRSAIRLTVAELSSASPDDGSVD